jgi:DNA-binding LytR/AlgR family response regulator
MESINCLIVDDEPLALDLIDSYVVKTPFLKLAGKCSSAFQAMEVMAAQNVDLLFLDIQMPGLTGVEFSKSLTGSVRVIFTTAYSEFALEGFKVDAIDYLVKPFNYAEFLRAANKALTWFSLSKASHGASDNGLKSMMVKAGSKLERVDLVDVIYIESMGDYVKIFCKDNEHPVITQMTMKSMEEKLPANKFFRVHRSFIVNIEQVRVIERNRIVFGKFYIPISESLRENFNQLLGDRFLM